MEKCAICGRKAIWFCIPSTKAKFGYRVCKRHYGSKEIHQLEERERNDDNIKERKICSS